MVKVGKYYIMRDYPKSWILYCTQQDSSRSYFTYNGRDRVVDQKQLKFNASFTHAQEHLLVEIPCPFDPRAKFLHHLKRVEERHLSRKQV